jgi:hypothetical protein
MKKTSVVAKATAKHTKGGWLRRKPCVHCGVNTTRRVNRVPLCEEGEEADNAA